MAKPSISLPDGLLEQVEMSRHIEIEGDRYAKCDRSQWIREAIRLRLALEDAGSWDEILAQYDVSTEESTNVTGEVPADD